MKCKIELPCKSHDKDLLWNSREGDIANKEHKLHKFQNSSGKEEGKVGKAHKGKKLDFNFFCLQLSLFGRLMKTLISQYSMKCAWNSLLLCSTRQFVNKIRKIKIPDESLRQMLILCGRPFQLWHLSLLGTVFPKTIFQQYLFSGLHKIFLKQIKLNYFVN